MLLAVGEEHEFRAPCRRVLEAASRGELRIHMSVEGGQEFLFHRLRRSEKDQALALFDLIDKLVVWHPFDVDVLRKSRDFVAQGALRGRDAVHAATAVNAGFDAIVSCDTDFDHVPGLKRLDPASLG